ncbi:ATPase, T2SS/T4P/T4SS family [Sphingomonas sp. RS6]
MNTLVETMARDAALALRLDDLLAIAADLGASHVHFDSDEAGMRIGYRVAGQMRAEGPLASFAVCEEIAQACELSFEARMPQNAVFRRGGETFDVAAMPAENGVRIVLHREAARGAGDECERLGMSPLLARETRAAIARRGLVLVAGPAGAGRSTTLATLLGVAAGRERPALAIGGETIPDRPEICRGDVERAPPAELLRAAPRQDFDVVMIDSLCDRVTAAAAVHAAQAGLLVLAGLAAPNAVAAVQQLRAWRVEAFELAASLNLVLAQRLVRRLCPHCRQPVQATGSVSALLGFDPGAIVYAPVGCALCEGSGFAGELAAFEAVRGDPAIRRLINDGGDAAILARHAFVSAPDLGAATRALVRSGVTTPEEAVRISRG